MPRGSAILGRNGKVGSDSIWNHHARVEWDEIDRGWRLEDNERLDLRLEMGTAMTLDLTVSIDQRVSQPAGRDSSSPLAASLTFYLASSR
jgi:hypothetical protein